MITNLLVFFEGEFNDVMSKAALKAIKRAPKRIMKVPTYKYEASCCG